MHPVTLEARSTALRDCLRNINFEKGRQKAAFKAKPWTKKGNFKINFIGSLPVY
jgi:hypothetical protein